MGKYLNFRVDDELYHDVLQRAGREGRPVSQLLRLAVRRYLDATSAPPATDSPQRAPVGPRYEEAPASKRSLNEPSFKEIGLDDPGWGPNPSLSKASQTGRKK